MKQVLHILRKDVRHLWIEIALSFIGLVWLGRTDWLVSSPNFVPRWYEQLEYPVIFLVFAWWFLVARLVQEESLVGNRQFWVTRPYEWHKLLAAKLLFVFLVIYIPALTVDVLLLKLAAFAVTSHLSEILVVNSEAALFLVIPVATLAAVTRKLAHWLLAMLGAILWIFGIVALDASLGRPAMTSENIFDFLQVASLLILAVITILIQYGRRQTPRAWAFVVVAVLIVPLIMIATPFRTVVNHEYPLSPERSLALQLRPGQKDEMRFLPARKGKVYVLLPFEVSGIPTGTILDLSGVTIDIDGPGGLHWSSPWQNAGNNLYPDTNRTEFLLQVDAPVYEQIRSGAARVRLTLAMTELKRTDERQVIAKPAFNLAGVGPCWITPFQSFISSSMRCRSIGISKYLLVTLSSDASTCPKRQDDRALPAGLTARSLNGANSMDPLAPLSLANLGPYRWDQETTSSVEPPAICPGTPLLIGTYEPSRKVRFEYDLGDIRLDDYRQSSTDSGLTRFSIGVGR